jgi:transposase
MDHPLYSPDFAPIDFWLFPKLKSVLKGKNFSDAEDIKSSVKKFLRHSCSGF